MKTKDEIFAEIRRIWWTLTYWTNGGKIKTKGPLFHDPLERDEKGISIL